VYLDDLKPGAVRVELYANGIDGNAPERVDMKRARQPADASDGYVYYSVTVSATHPATDYTARIIPHCDGVAIPLEAAHVLWQR